METILIDDRARPPLRAVIGGLLSTAHSADFAIARLRIDGLDIAGPELMSLKRCRILIGRLDARTLEDMMGGQHRGPAERHHLEAINDFFASGRVEVRAAGIFTWNPDFSIFSGASDQNGPETALVGAHYFLRPYQVDGAAFTMLIRDPEEVRGVRLRFNELWELGYDVGEVVRAALLNLDDELASTRQHAIR